MKPKWKEYACTSCLIVVVNVFICIYNDILIDQHVWQLSKCPLHNIKLYFVVAYIQLTTEETALSMRKQTLVA